jgi:fatty-acyl-CoA synthase
VKSRIARFKAPKVVELVEQLPKTSTGKVQKFELREKEWSGHTSRIRG